MAQITGTTGNTVKVDNNSRLHTEAVTSSSNLHAAENGNAYNINTGLISLTTSTDSGVLYFKNGEELDFHIQAVAVGVNTLGTNDDSTKIRIVRNPTTGTLISDATAVDINENRNFGSTNTLGDSLAYKGAEGKTVTDGDDIIIFYMGAGSRLFAAIDLVLPKNSSMAVVMDTATSAGTTSIYAALVGNLIDPEAHD